MAWRYTDTRQGSPNEYLRGGTALVPEKLIQFRKDTYAALSAQILAEGEPAYITDHGSWVVGDGSSLVSALFAKKGTFNVKDYGAVGDDSTDDYAAIQAAIHAAGDNGGGVVVFPEGTYKILTRLVHEASNGDTAEYVSYLGIAGGGTLGSGYGAEIRYKGSDETGCLLIEGPADGAATTEHIKAGTISNLGFAAATATARASSTFAAIAIIHSSGWKITDCAFRNCEAGIGIHIYGRTIWTQYIKIDNPMGYNNRRDIVLEGAATDVEIRGGSLLGTSTASGSDSRGVELVGDRARRVKIFGTQVNNKTIHYDLGPARNSHVYATCEQTGAFKATGTGVSISGDNYYTVAFSVQPGEAFANGEAITWNGGADSGVAKHTLLKGSSSVLTYVPDDPSSVIASGDVVVGAMNNTGGVAAGDDSASGASVFSSGNTVSVKFINVGTAHDFDDTYASVNTIVAPAYEGDVTKFAGTTGQYKVDGKELKFAKHTMDSGTGTETITGALPPLSVIHGVTVKNEVAVAGTGGVASYSIGDGTDVDLWGAGIVIALDTKSSPSDFTAFNKTTGAAAGDVVLTADTGTFTSGTVTVVVHFTPMDGDAI